MVHHLLDELIRTHDLVVSLLPYTHHVTVAEKCMCIPTGIHYHISTCMEYQR